MTKQKRTVFFISDGTGITAETLGHSLLTQFDNFVFDEQTIPYINNLEKAKQVVEKIKHVYECEKQKKLDFSTLIDASIYKNIKHYPVDFIDYYSILASAFKDYQ